MTGEITQIVNRLSPEWVTAIATAIYMFFTWRLIIESRKGRKLQESPQLDVFVERAKEWWSNLNLIIKNNGLWSAYNIKLQTDKDFNLFDRNDQYTLKNLGFFKNWIAFLPPSGSRENFFINITNDYEEKIKRKININTSYNDKYWHTTKNIFVIDLSEFEDTMLPQELPIYKISKNIEKIQKDFHSVISGFRQLKVLTQSKEEKQQEKLKEMEESKNILEAMKNLKKI